MAWKDEMKKAAADGDEDAKKCLEAMGDGDGDEKKEGAEEEKKDEKADAGDGDGDKKDEKKGDDEKKEPASEEEKKDEKAAASASAKVDAVIDAAVEERVNARLRPIELKAVLDERVKSDPGMPEAFKKHCMTLSSADELRKLLAVTPPFARIRNEAPTVGRHEDEEGPGLKGEELVKMNEAMGLGSVETKMPGKGDDGVFRLHVVKPSDVRKILDQRAAGASKGK